jgi:hypothetical protein
MTRFWIGAAALAALLGAAPMGGQLGAQVMPQHFTGGTTGDLARLCSQAPGDAMGVGALGWCEGFLVGVGQFHRAVTAPSGRIRPIYCLPNDDSLTLNQVRQAFVTWAAANPQHAGERAVDGLVRFAQATYPCASSVRRTR